MGWVEPIRLNVNKIGMFDFPCGIQTKDCLGNVDPGTPLMEELYGKLGSPGREQGLPVIKETSPEPEDPKMKPYIDAILDINHPISIFHTGRLSGSMVIELADNTHFSKVKVHAVPYKHGDAVRIFEEEKTLEPKPQTANEWYWLSENELVYTLSTTFRPTARETKLEVGEVYRLLIEWEFSHLVAGRGRHNEPFSGFDDSISFKVGQMTIV